jgi:GNAT superfamily N-acetyltransferase
MEKQNSIQIFNATRLEHFDQVRSIIRAFVAWHRQRHAEDLKLIDEYFDAKAFEAELASLPGKYALPKGRLLLALYDGEPAGCAALREIDNESCEMKRMFVYDKFHGKGIGAALTEKLIREARIIGYSTIKLDTSIRQVEAQKLYEKMGFKRTTPYYQLPKKLEEWLVFMEMEL